MCVCVCVFHQHHFFLIYKKSLTTSYHHLISFKNAMLHNIHRRIITDKNQFENIGYMYVFKKKKHCFHFFSANCRWWSGSSLLSSSSSWILIVVVGWNTEIEYNVKKKKKNEPTNRPRPRDQQQQQQKHLIYGSYFS